MAGKRRQQNIGEVGLNQAAGKRLRLERAGQPFRPGGDRKLMPFDAAAQGEALFRTVLDHLPSVIRIYDSELRLRFINGAGCTLSGRPLSDLLGKREEELWPEEVYQHYLPHLQEAARTKTPQSFEMNLTLPNGRRCSQVVNYAPLLDDTGRLTYLMGIACDIAECKRLEEDLRRSEEQARDLIRHAPTGIFEVDFHGPRFTSVNEVMCRHLGYTREELLAMNPSDLLGEPGKILLLERIAQPLAAEKRQESIECRVKTKSGREFHAVLNSTFTYRDGEPQSAFVIAHDVTEQRQMQRQLAESEQRLRLALEGGQMGSWEWDLRTDTMFWCPRVHALLGVDTFRKARIETLLDHVHPEDREAVKKLMARSLTDLVDFEVEFRALHQRDEPYGEILWLASHAKVIREEQGQAVRMIGVMYDITQRKQMEAELRRMNEHLEAQIHAQTEELRDTVDRLQTAKAELEHRADQLQQLTLELVRAEDHERRRLAEILHDDLQQMLAAAKFHLGLLDNRARSDAELRDIVESIKQMLKEAIEKSRSLSHELSPTVLYEGDLDDTFEWLARQMEKKHGLKTHLEFRGRLTCDSEPVRAFLYRAAQEILFNVVKHARVREAKLRLQRVHNELWLTISDRGVGFDACLPVKADGFGLLSIRERAELMGGRMRVKSIPGHGSIFLITVPDAPGPKQ